LTHRTGWYQDSGRFVPVGLWSSTSVSAEVPGADEERKADAGSAHWADALPDRVTVDSIVDRRASAARRIDLGGVDMRQASHDQARTSEQFRE